MIVISFTFFGSFNPSDQPAQPKDKVIGKSVDGSDLYLFEIQRLARFISTDRSDVEQLRGELPNLLNDGVVRVDFLETGLADLLARTYFDLLKEEMQSRLTHVQKFRPYAHPRAPFISVAALWDRFYPQIGEEIQALKKEETATPEMFAHLAKLYLEQTHVPQELTRRILLYQMQQIGGLEPDPQVQYGDFSLFGYHTLKDWFGSNYIDMTAQFIHNAALVAEEKGYRVGANEAKADLLRNFEQSLKGSKQSISFQQQLRAIGLEEKEAIEAWRKVLLFRRYIRGAGEATLLDSLPFKDLAAFAREKAVVHVYQLPESLKLQSADDLFALQFYIDTVGVAEKEILSLPLQSKPIEEIEKKAPAFVEVVYKGVVSSVSQEELSMRASMREVLQWQMDHWDEMAKKFPSLSQVFVDREKRFLHLESAPNRGAIDSWSRLQVVYTHPEWVEEAFEKARKKGQTISLSSGRTNLPFIENPDLFAEQIREAHLQGASLTVASDFTLYRIEQIEQESNLRIRSLADMKQDGSLLELVDSHLEKKYVQIRETTPSVFQAEGGGWRPFSEVKEKVGMAVYADLIRSIDRQEKTSNQPISFYVSRRMAGPMHHAWDEAQKEPIEMKGIDQFKLVRQEKELHRTAEENWMNNEAFFMVPNQWSPVYVPEDGQIVFFYLQEKKWDEEPVLAQMQAAKTTISKNAQLYLAKALLGKIQKHKAIVIPMQKEDDHV